MDRTSQRGKENGCCDKQHGERGHDRLQKVDVTSQSFDRQLAVKIDDPTIGPNIKQGIGGVNLGVKIGETYYDMSQGNFRQTEDQYNLALSGSGFLPSAQQTRVERQRHATRAMAISL